MEKNKVQERETKLNKETCDTIQYNKKLIQQNRNHTKYKQTFLYANNPNKTIYTIHTTHISNKTQNTNRHALHVNLKKTTK